MIRFNKLFSEYPIQNKLIYSSMLGSVVAFIPVILIMVVYEYFVLRSDVVEKLKIQSVIVSESVAAAMAFHDETAAYETLYGLHGSKDMIEAHLVLPDGTLFKSYYKDSKKAPLIKHFDATVSEIETFTPFTVRIEKAIYLREQFVGSITLVSSLHSYYNYLLWYVSIIIIASVFGLLLARWIAVRISQTITEPLRHLTDVTKKIVSEKEYATPIFIETQDEIGTLSQAFEEMLLQIRKRDTSLQNLAYYDRVTGLANRHYFEERIAQVVENAQRYGTLCYLLMIDLDDFKTVNDTLGHHAGDLLLQHVSKSLSAILRHNDILYRIGGDEFAILVENKTEVNFIEQLAEKVIATASSPLILGGQQVQVGASVGISSFPEFSTDVKTLMSTADSAMYVAKSEGKNRYRKYAPSSE